MDLSVKDGYLKNAEIEFAGRNYSIEELIDDSQIIQNTENEQILLKQLGENTYSIIAKIGTKFENKISLNELNKDSKITLKAIYVNSKGEEQQIEKDVTVNVKFTGENELQLDQELNSYFTYQVNGENKTLVRLSAKLNTINNKNNLPIKQTTLEVKVPTLNGTKPESVNAVLKSTEMTNGQTEANVFYEDSQIKYDEEKSVLNINVENTVKDDKVNIANGQDEYLITYVYPGLITNTSIVSNASAKLIEYTGEEEKELNVSSNKEIEVKDKKGDSVVLELATNKQNINKGKIYANAGMEDKKYETKYNTQLRIDISNKDIANKINIKDNSTYFVDQNSNQYSIENYAHYLKTTISKNNFEKILGTDGTIKIYNQLGNLIAQIDSLTKTDENGNYLVTYPEDTTKVVIETSKPQNAGILYINNTKSIKADIPYSKNDLKGFTKLEEKINENTISYNLEETNTNANITLNRTNLSTIVMNEDVEMSISLDNNRENSDLYENPTFFIEMPEYIEDVTVKSANILYDEGLQIQNIEKLNQDGKLLLKVTLQGTQNGFSTGTFSKGTNIVLNTDIKAKLLTPSKDDTVNLYYSNPNAIAYASSVVVGEQVLGTSQANISYSTPVGMIAVSSISNYENTGKIATSINQGKVTDKIEIFADAKIAKMNVKLVNNTGNICSDVVAIGRIPFKGNRDVNSNEELGTTVDSLLKSKLVANGISEDKVAIYYSENGEATKDLNDDNNKWILEPQDLSKIKSYLIVLKDYQMKNGETIDFTYDFEIPANLEYGNSLYGSFEAFFTNNTDVGKEQEKASADVVGLSTGDGPKLSAYQIAFSPYNTVKEGQIFKMKVYIENTGSTPLENVILREFIPKYTKYTEYQEGSGDYGEVSSGYIYPATKIDESTKKEYIDMNIGTIDVGMTAIQDFYLEVQNVPKTIYEYYQGTPGFSYDEETGKYYMEQYGEENNGTYEILSRDEIKTMPEIKTINEVNVYAKGLEKPLSDQSSEIKIESTSFKVEEKPSVDKSISLEEGDELSYTTTITNKSNEKLTNVIAQKEVPNGLTFKQANILKYNEETSNWENGTETKLDTSTNTVTWNLGDLEANESKKIKFTGIVNKLDEGKYEKEIISQTAVSADNNTKFMSAETINTVAKPKLEVTISNDATKEYISEEDNITYTIKVKNVGKNTASSVKIEDVLPNELRFLKGNYITTDSDDSQELKEYNNKVSLTTNIKPDEQITLSIAAQAKNLPNDQNEVTIYNYATLTGENVEGIQTESLVTRIEQSAVLPNPPGTNGNNGGNGSSNSTDNTANKTYRIRGTAWIDSNANGARESDEPLLEGINVMLANASTGEIAKDKDTGAEKKTATAKDGSYVFENLENGNYIVVFYYDNQIYTLTDYKKTGVADNLNSDVIASKVTLNGQEKMAAITDTINLNNSSYANIDMGLVNSKKFDLKLDKYITKVTLQNKEGIKTFDYNDAKVGKVDITAKKMVGSTVIAEYKIKVTNEGNVAGYATNIVDYMPKEMNFNSNLNSNWYAGNDGNLYSKELANQLINPGESKEITLVLTNKVSDTNSSIISNLAEIYEEYNELGITDQDSTVKNQAQGEDDMSSADLVVTIKTGKAVTYTCALIIGLIALAYTVNILRKKNARYYN